MTDASWWLIAGLIIVGTGFGLALGGRRLVRFLGAGLTVLFGALCLLVAGAGLFALVAAAIGALMLMWPVEVLWKRLKGPASG